MTAEQGTATYKYRLSLPSVSLFLREWPGCCGVHACMACRVSMLPVPGQCCSREKSTLTALGRQVLMMQSASDSTSLDFWHLIGLGWGAAMDQRYSTCIVCGRYRVRNRHTAKHPPVSLMGTGVLGRVWTLERGTCDWNAAFTLDRGPRPWSIWQGPWPSCHIAWGERV